MKSTKELSADKKGRYYRNIGWKWNRMGTGLAQHKFLLGRDEHQARDREARLQVLWSLVEQYHEDECAEPGHLQAVC